MLLTIATTYQPASDLGFLLHKHPDRFQTFELGFGKCHIFYPEANATRCLVALLLDVDPVNMARSQQARKQNFALAGYVNDRPFVASSFMSTAISQVLGSALAGRCPQRPDLVTVPIPLEVSLDVLPVRGGETMLRRLGLSRLRVDALVREGSGFIANPICGGRVGGPASPSGGDRSA